VWQKDKDDVVTDTSTETSDGNTDIVKAIDMAQAEKDDMLMCMALGNRYYIVL
jgi:hypothetical protein